MKKLLILLSILPSLLLAQDIDRVFAGMTIDTLSPEQAKKYENTTRVRMVTDAEDKATYVFNYKDSDKARLLVVFLSGTQAVKAAVLLDRESGIINIDKKAFEPGHYRGFVFAGDETDGQISFDVEVNSKVKGSLGDYVIYWDKTHFTYKYIGLD